MAMTASMILRLRDNMSAKLKKNEKGLKTLGRVGGQALGKLNQGIGKVNGTLAGMGLTMGLGAAVKKVADMDAAMTRLGTQANVSAQRMDALKKRIFETATAPDIQVDPGQIISAIDQIIERTGDMEFVEQNLMLIGSAIQAVGADGSAIGGLVAEFQKMGLSSDEVAEALGTLAKQGKNGAFTLENLASLGPRVISAYTATGRNGTEALREMGAALQVIRTATGSSEQAATAFEAVMRSLTDKKKQDSLKKMGVHVRNSANQFKPINELMAEIVEKAEGSPEKLSTIFDAEAMRAFFSVIKEGNIDNLAKFYEMQDDGAIITKDSARNAATFNANMTNLRTSLSLFADENLSEPIGRLAEKLNQLESEQIRAAFRAIAWGLGAIAAVKGISAVANTVGSIANLVRRAKSGPGKSGVLPGMSPASGAQPVFVTNWPGGLLGGSSPAGGLGGGGGKSKGLSKKGYLNALRGRKGGWFGRGLRVANKTKAGRALGKGLRFGGKALGRAAVPLAIGSSLLEGGLALANPTMSRRDKYKAVGGAAGSGLGGWGGAAAGAAIGSAILPGVGTALGGLLGGLGGSLLGDLVGKKAGEAIQLNPRNEGGKAPGGEIVVRIDARTDESTRITNAVEAKIPGYRVNTGRFIEALP